MSKAKLKKFLSGLTEEQLRETILELYDARKEAKEYLEYFLDPDEEKAREKARQLLFRHYFNTQGKPRSKAGVKVAKDMVDNFIKLSPAPEKSVDLLLYNCELLYSWLVMRRIVSESAWNTALNQFAKAVAFITGHRMESQFQHRIDELIEYGKHTPEYLRIPERMGESLAESIISSSEI